MEGGCAKVCLRHYKRAGLIYMLYLGKASKKKSHKLELFAQPPLTPPSLLNLGPLSDYTFLAFENALDG